MEDLGIPRYYQDKPQIISSIKKVVRQLYIDGFGNFLFDMNKFVYPPPPFCIDIYKFTKVKSAPNFVREIENFHFREKIFYKNDAWDKVSKYCASAGVHLEYSHHFDKNEEIYRNACNITSLKKRFKKKITTMGGKGSSKSTSEQ